MSIKFNLMFAKNSLKASCPYDRREYIDLYKLIQMQDWTREYR